MRSLPGPTLPPPARVGAVQPINVGPSGAVVSRRGGIGAGDAAYTAHYQDWQSPARRYARSMGAPSFTATVIADMCARCDLQVEELVDVTSAASKTTRREWKPTEDPTLIGIEDEYANELLVQGPNDLVRLQAWHYQVAGEHALVTRDAPDGGPVEYLIVSLASISKNKPQAGLSTVKLIPDGKIENGTAFVVPNEQIIRLWIPDQEWPAYATSPMASTIDDLHRYRALSRYAWRTAESGIAMNGVLWVPSEAFEDLEPPLGEDGEPVDQGVPADVIEAQYYGAALQRFSDTDDITARAPYLVKWSKEAGAPEFVKLGDGLDSATIEHKSDALADFSRGTALPVSTVEGGGMGDLNHWSEWLASRKMFDSGAAPTMDRITHADITRTFLWRRLIQDGWRGDRLRRVRMGYDATRVIVEADKSEIALKAAALGAIGYVALREYCGFTEDDAPTPEEREQMLEFLAHGSKGSSGGDATELPVNGGNVRKRPPEEPTALAAAVGTARPKDAGKARVLAQLAKLRSSLGTRVLAEAQHAYDAALARAGVKVKTRSQRQSTSRRRETEQAVDSRAPLAPILAAINMDDTELLAASFDTFRARVVDEFQRYQERARSVISRAGLDADALMGEETEAEQAADYLVAGLTAMARRRLLLGDQALLAAVSSRLVPRARRPSGGGFDLPGLPDPEELASAAARLVRNALAISDGRASMRMPTTPDEFPEVTTLDNVPTVEQQLAATIEVQPEWQWVHGFYGEPTTVFEPHDDLDGYTTTDRDGDPELINTEDWPEGELLQPGDHDGCTCEWVLVPGSIGEGE